MKDTRDEWDGAFLRDNLARHCQHGPHNRSGSFGHCIQPSDSVRQQGKQDSAKQIIWISRHPVRCFRFVESEALGQSAHCGVDAGGIKTSQFCLCDIVLRYGEQRLEATGFQSLAQRDERMHVAKAAYGGEHYLLRHRVHPRDPKQTGDPIGAAC